MRRAIAQRPAQRARRHPRAPIVTAVLDPRTPGHVPSFGGPTGGDLYLSVAPGYNVSARLDAGGGHEDRAAREHFLDPEQLRHACGVRHGRARGGGGAQLGLIRQIDVAPTLCLLLGIEPPAQATGLILRSALGRTQPCRRGVETAFVGRQTDLAAASLC